MTIEELIIDYLADKLSVPVSGDVPTGGTAFVTVEKTGSRESNLIVTDTLAVQSWAMSRADAMALNELVKSTMDAAIELDGIFRSHCETDYNFTDTQKKHWRYQAVYEIVHNKTLEMEELNNA